MTAPVKISEKDKAVDFKCGTQSQTYNAHKVTNFHSEEAWPNFRQNAQFIDFQQMAFMKMWDIEFIKRCQKFFMIISRVH